MNDPAPHAWRWLAVGLLAAVAVMRPSLAVPVTHIAVLALAGLALLPVVGWLRTLWFAPLPAATAAAWAAAAVLHRGQAVTLAFAVATVVGAVVGAAVAFATHRLQPALRPWVSLLVAAAVSGVVLPSIESVPLPAPLLFGIDLAGDRVLATVALAFLAAGLWVVTNLAASRAGREIATAGASAQLAIRAGASPRDAWLRAGIVSGVLAGWVGLLLTLDVQGLPGTLHLGPAVAVSWLAVAVVGGAAWPTGVMLGALLVGGIAPLIGAAEPIVAGVALALGAVLGERGLVGVVSRRWGIG